MKVPRPQKAHSYSAHIRLYIGGALTQVGGGLLCFNTEYLIVAMAGNG